MGELDWRQRDSRPPVFQGKGLRGSKGRSVLSTAARFDAPLIHEMATVISIEGRAKHHTAVRAERRRIMEGLTF